MAARTCSMCDEKPRGKMASFYWRWYWPSGDARAWKQLLDRQCAGDVIDRIRLSAEHNGECVKCGDEIKYPHSITLNGWVYLPGYDRQDVEIEYCETCFVQEEDLYTRGGTRLEDREVQARGPSPGPQDDPWAGLGIIPF